MQAICSKWHWTQCAFLPVRTKVRGYCSNGAGLMMLLGPEEGILHTGDTHMLADTSAALQDHPANRCSIYLILHLDSLLSSFQLLFCSDLLLPSPDCGRMGAIGCNFPLHHLAPAVNKVVSTAFLTCTAKAQTACEVHSQDPRHVQRSLMHSQTTALRIAPALCM